jgi:hypothetical protein
MNNDYYKDLYERMERAYANEVRKNIVLLDLLDKATTSMAESKKLMEVVNLYLESLASDTPKGSIQ